MNESVIVACPLCGSKYNRDQAKCSGCPIGKNCNVICCPHCGYQTVDDTYIKNIFTRIRSFMLWVKQKI